MDGWVRIVPNFYKSLFYDIFYKKNFKLFWQIHVKSPRSMILRGVLVPNLCGGWGGSQIWYFFQNKTVFYGIPSSFFSTACECFSVHDYGNQGMCVTHSQYKKDNSQRNYDSRSWIKYIIQAPTSSWPL